jgi:hypothetical protein
MSAVSASPKPSSDMTTKEMQSVKDHDLSPRVQQGDEEVSIGKEALHRFGVPKR